MGQSYVNLSQVIQTTQIYLKTLQDLKKNLKLHIKFAQVTCTCIRISSVYCRHSQVPQVTSDSLFMSWYFKVQSY